MDFQTDTLFPGLLDAAGKSREAYRSLAHYWESEKYRELDEPTRQRVLDIPTVRELTKEIPRLPQAWRPDWARVRARVFRSALHYAGEGEPPSFAQEIDIEQLAASCSRWSISEAFVRREAATFLAHYTHPLRLLAVGSAEVPSAHVEATPERLVGEREDVRYVAFAGRGMDASLHQWAASRHFPVIYEGACSDRPLDESATRRLIERCTHMVAFAAEGKVPDEEAIETARELRRTIRISQYRGAGLSHSPNAGRLNNPLRAV